MGRIAAGTPIEALQTRSHTISVPPDMLGSGEHYALEVRGNSMVDAGILDGDMALIQRNETADTGDIVVALIDERKPRSSASAAAAPRSRWSLRTPPTKSASCRRTGSGFRAS